MSSNGRDYALTFYNSLPAITNTSPDGTYLYLCSNLDCSGNAISKIDSFQDYSTITFPPGDTAHTTVGMDGFLVVSYSSVSKLWILIERLSY